jgi:hypothetical protein
VIRAFVWTAAFLALASCSAPPVEEPEPQAQKPKAESEDVVFVRQDPPPGEPESTLTMHPGLKWTMNHGGKKSSGTVQILSDQVVFTILDSPEGKPKPPYDKFGGTYVGDTLALGPAQPPVVHRRR